MIILFLCWIGVGLKRQIFIFKLLFDVQHLDSGFGKIMKLYIEDAYQLNIVHNNMLVIVFQGVYTTPFGHIFSAVYLSLSSVHNEVNMRSCVPYS